MQRRSSTPRCAIGIAALVLLPGCLSSARLQAQPVAVRRVYEGTTSAFADCVIAAHPHRELSGLFIWHEFRRGLMRRPDDVEDVESGSSDLMGRFSPLSSFTARRIGDGLIAVEFRRITGIFSPAVDPDLAFAPVADCLGTRRIHLEDAPAAGP